MRWCLRPTLYLSALLMLNACGRLNASIDSPTRLAFSRQPASVANYAESLTTQPVVAIEHGAEVDPMDAAPITLGIYSDSKCTKPISGNFQIESKSVLPASGKASFSGLSFRSSIGAVVYLKATARDSKSACSEPITVQAQPSVSTAANDSFSCFVSHHGHVYCTGANTYGQLGNDTTTSSATPVKVSGIGGMGYLNNILSVSTGSGFACALSTTGTVYCWGRNNGGQLGIAGNANVHTPVLVKSPTGKGPLGEISSISSGFDHSCVTTYKGSVYCWGHNSFGELGDHTFTQSNLPIAVNNPAGTGALTNVASVSAGNQVSCAVLNEGSAYCWGKNNYGQLGNRTNTASSIPVQVVNVNGVGALPGIQKVSVGSSSVCAITTSGAAFCWGDNTAGQLGNRNTVSSNYPVSVLSAAGLGALSNIAQVSVGTNSACALQTSGDVFCWGAGKGGQLGNRTKNDSGLPVQVVSQTGVTMLKNAVSISAGYGYSCAVLDMGSAYCWGMNQLGSFGDNRPGAINLIPSQVLNVNLNDSPLSNIIAIANSNGASCALSSAGNVYCWGAGMNSATPKEVADVSGSGFLSGIVAISDHCGLSSRGNVFCWNRQGTTEVASGSGNGYLSNIVQVAGRCALSSFGNVFCWGENDYGQIGNGTTKTSTVPTRVLGVRGATILSGITKIDSNSSGTACAISKTGNLYCWGENSFGQVGDGTTRNALAPHQVLGVNGKDFLTSVTSVSTGKHFTCASDAATHVYCWGWGSFGQLGNNQSNNSSTPVPVVDVTGVGQLGSIVNIAANNLGACGLSNTNAVYCWGWVSTISSYPQLLQGPNGDGFLSNIVAVAASRNGGYALSGTGNVFSFGVNGGTLGELGQGTTSPNGMPVLVNSVFHYGALSL